MIYKRVKDNTDLLAMTKIPIMREQYLHAYIWNNKAAMYENCNWPEHNYAACYIGVEHTKRKFGEIHLVKDEFGGGLFAHELQHLVLHWIHEYGNPQLSYEKEEVCHMVGTITNKFWTWFYDNGFELAAEAD